MQQVYNTCHTFSIHRPSCSHGERDNADLCFTAASWLGSSLFIYTLHLRIITRAGIICCSACMLLCISCCCDAVVPQVGASVRAEPRHVFEVSEHRSHVFLCCIWNKKSVPKFGGAAVGRSVTAGLSIKSVAMTESLTTSAKQGINIIMDYTVLSCRGGQIAELHRQYAALQLLPTAYIPHDSEVTSGHPVHCHAAFSVLITDTIFLLNEPTLSLSWIHFAAAVLCSVRSAWQKRIIYASVEMFSLLSRNLSSCCFSETKTGSEQCLW